MGDVVWWRVVDDVGVTRDVAVCVADGTWAAAFPAEPSWPRELGTNARGAVMRVCALCRVDAVEILAPGEASAAERVAAETLRCIGVADASREHYGKHWTRAQHTAVAAVAWEMRPKAAAAGDASAKAVPR